MFPTAPQLFTCRRRDCQDQICEEHGKGLRVDEKEGKAVRRGERRTSEEVSTFLLQTPDERV